MELLRRLLGRVSICFIYGHDFEKSGHVRWLLLRLCYGSVLFLLLLLHLLFFSPFFSVEFPLVFGFSSLVRDSKQEEPVLGSRA